MKVIVTKSIASVYVMQQVGSNYYKIGVSNDPLGLVNDVSNGNPFGVELLMFGALLNPYERESELHDHFSNERIRPNGEWFKLCKMDLKSTEETLKSWVQQDREVAIEGNLSLHKEALSFRKAPNLSVVYGRPKEQNIDDYL